jgi:hypothetical protein
MLIHVSCPESLMRTRGAKRSEELPAGALFIDANAFNLFQSRSEPLGEDEPNRRVETGDGAAL